MTRSDKTRQKLVDSMRKTKEEPPVTPAVKKKRATTRSAKNKPEAGAANRLNPATAGAGSRPANHDPYQGGRRVWPD